MHVLNACREARVKKIVMQSTTALYGPHASNPNFLRESHPLRGIPGNAFLADKMVNDRIDLYIASADGSGAVLMLNETTSSDEDAMGPLFWSPDGTSMTWRIHFTSTDATRLYVSSTLGGEPRFIGGSYQLNRAVWKVSGWSPLSN